MMSTINQSTQGVMAKSALLPWIVCFRFGASFLGDSDVWRHVLMTTVVFARTFVNFVGSGLVVKFGNFANFVKLGLRAAFFVVASLGRVAVPDTAAVLCAA